MEFYRIKKGKVIGGICNGIADKYGWKVDLVRVVALALLIVFNLIAIAIYLILWFVLPALDDVNSKMADEIKEVFQNPKK